jgi:hypothetical protein
MSQSRFNQAPVSTTNLKSTSILMDSRKEKSMTRSPISTRDRSLKDHCLIPNPSEPPTSEDKQALFIKQLKSSLDAKRQSLITSLNAMNIQVFIELERIKRPSISALQTGKLACQFFRLFRNSEKT